MPRPLLLTVAALTLSACATTPSAQTAPPAAGVTQDHYTGTWLEIGRRPMWLTDNCVAGYTTYSPGNKPGEIAVIDGCHKDTPTGKLKTVHGRGVLSADKATLVVHYPFFITFTYRVLYEASDHSWFISADPAFKNLWIYTRAVPSPDQRAVMVEKAKALGYDTTQLEFPAP